MKRLDKIKERRDKYKTKYQTLDGDVKKRIKETEDKLIAEIGKAFYRSLHQGDIDKDYVLGFLKLHGDSKINYEHLVNETLSLTD